jgi:hypothetical protein
MPFENGSASLRVMRLTRPLPKDAVERFAQNALAPVEYIKEDPLFGWVTGRHLMDRDIDEHTARWGGILRVALVKAEKKVPSSLLKAEVRAQELQRLKESGQSFLSRKDRQEIRDATRAILLPKMPPQLKGTAVLQVPGSEWVLTEAVADKAADELCIHFRHAQQITLEAMTPATLAEQRHKIDVTGWSPTSFSPAVEDKDVSPEAGHDFLTWLWHVSETAPKSLEVEGHGPVGVLIEGPLTFVMEGSGAHEITLRKGNPPVSSEAKACLLAGKKLARCKFSLAKGEEVWSGTLTAESFVTRSLKPPAVEEDLDPVSLFQMRVRKFEEYREMLAGLYDLFVRVRSDRQRWTKTAREMREWVADRTALN